jgi:succinate dehydrogenase/fumarate reductase flavoprotein subunit
MSWSSMPDGTGQDAHSCDVLVIGAGAAGLTTAITARKLGLDVLVVEKEPVFGGTTALSGGWLWVPCSSHALKAGIVDSLDSAREYLRSEIGASFDAAKVDAYLENAPRMVDFLERETAVRFMLGPTYPDYHPDQPGGKAAGRAICAMPFDGRELGADLARLRLPVREMTLYGLKVGSGPDFHHFLNARRSLRSAWHVTRRIARHAADVLLHGRDLLLMSGNALAARLARSALDLGIPVWLNAPAVELLQDTGPYGTIRVRGAIVQVKGKPVHVSARCGVVCAGGGFSHDLARRQQLFAHKPAAGEHYSLAAPGNTGDGLRLAESVGGYVETRMVAAAPWMPVSRVSYADGSSGTYPHSYERGKPGVIAVTVAGTRFANESNSYHDVVQALIDTQADGQPLSAFLVCDHRFVQRYGLGIAKPFPLPLRPYLRSGYLLRAGTLAALAAKAGIAPEALERTVAQFNANVALGTDPDFGRGTNAYNAYQGDPAHRPNPCLASIVHPPFYCVKIVPGDLGTFMGIATNAWGGVINRGGAPVEGLFAVGNDMASLFDGHYPGPGSNLGPAMTFGYLCARYMAGQFNPS